MASMKGSKKMIEYHVVRVSNSELYGHEAKTCKRGCANPVGSQKIGVKTTGGDFEKDQEIVGTIIGVQNGQIVSVEG